VVLKKGKKRLASADSNPEGRFRLDGVPVRSGTCELEYQPYSPLLLPARGTVFVGDGNIERVEVGVESVLGKDAFRTTITGEVYSAGGGKALSGVRVHLLSRGYRVGITETNAFGRYEFIRAIVSAGDVTLVFIPRNRVFLPVTLKPALEKADLNILPAVLPSLELSPVENARFQGKVESFLGDHNWGYDIRFYLDDIPLIRGSFYQSFFNWGLQMPLGEYKIQVKDHAFLLKLPPQRIQVMNSEPLIANYRMLPSIWFYASVLLVFLVLAGAGIYFFRLTGKTEYKK